MKELTATQKFILSFLDGKGFVSPSKIGNAYGATIGKPYLHSSFASPICKKLVELGLLERSDNGHYCITYDGKELNDKAIKMSEGAKQ